MAHSHDQGFRNFMIDPNRAVFGGQVDINGRADGADVTVGDPAGNVRLITVQLKDALGNNVTYRQSVWVAVFADVTGDNFAAIGGSTGISASGSTNDPLAPVAKKLFLFRSDATGGLTLRWTDTDREVAFLGMILPSGRTVISPNALTI